MRWFNFYLSKGGETPFVHIDWPSDIAREIREEGGAFEFLKSVT